MRYCQHYNRKDLLHVVALSTQLVVRNGFETSESWMALYGSVVIQRAICPQCGRTALVIDRVMACCGTEPPPPTGFKRECLPDGLRHLPPIAARRERLRIQENKCFYCLNTFGMRVLRGRQILRLSVGMGSPSSIRLRPRQLQRQLRCRLLHLQPHEVRQAFQNHR